MPTFRAFAGDDPLNRRVVAQMLVGVATRQYGRSLEPLGPDVRTRGTSKSAVSRRFVAQTQAHLDAWRATPLAELDLAVLLLDGVHVGTHCIVVALGIDVTGQKHALGVWEGATENTTVCQETWPLPAGVDPKESAERRDALVHRFGNLTLLTNTLNPAISNSQGPRSTPRSWSRAHSL